ncbi:uncharacterized protein METZ01_LOCUS407103, partial [marine metagenome]
PVKGQLRQRHAADHRRAGFDAAPAAGAGRRAI